MKNKHTILLDLDGTITDPKQGIFNAVCYAFERLNVVAPCEQDLRKFIGPPLRESFAWHLPAESVERSVELYREFYAQTGIMQCVLYEGMEQLIAQLFEQGKSLVLATAKPEVYATRILHEFDLAKYFAFLSGTDLEGKISTKSQIIERALIGANVQDKSKAVMVGDRFYDIEGAHAQGIDSIGVLFGYGTRQELEQARASKIVESVEELRSLLAYC